MAYARMYAHQGRGGRGAKAPRMPQWVGSSSQNLIQLLTRKVLPERQVFLLNFFFFLFGFEKDPFLGTKSLGERRGFTVQWSEQIPLQILQTSKWSKVRRLEAFSLARGRYCPCQHFKTIWDFRTRKQHTHSPSHFSV